MQRQGLQDAVHGLNADIPVSGDVSDPKNAASQREGHRKASVRQFFGLHTIRDSYRALSHSSGMGFTQRFGQVSFLLFFGTSPSATCFLYGGGRARKAKQAVFTDATRKRSFSFCDWR